MFLPLDFALDFKDIYYVPYKKSDKYFCNVMNWLIHMVSVYLN